MNARQRRAVARKVEAELAKRGHAETAEEKRTTDHLLEELRRSHAEVLAAQSAAWAEEHNERVRLEGVIADLRSEVALANARIAEVEHELAGEVTARQSAAARVAELADELGAAKRDLKLATTENPASLRRRLGPKSTKIDELNRRIHELEACLREERKARPWR